MLPDGYRITALDSEGLWIDHEGRRFPLGEMSDGYRTVVALVVDLLKQLFEAFGELHLTDNDGQPASAIPGVVIIDEVHAHLHVSWQKRIGTWLKRHFPQIQFIVTTHSPYVCQAADQGGLITMPGPNDSSRHAASTTTCGSGSCSAPANDAVLSDLFGLDTAYSDQAIALREELVQLEVAVLSGKADRQQRSRYRQLLARHRPHQRHPHQLHSQQLPTAHWSLWRRRVYWRRVSRRPAANRRPGISLGTTRLGSRAGTSGSGTPTSPWISLRSSAANDPGCELRR